jgi:transposase
MICIEELAKTNEQVGIDLGLKDFVITSDNKKFKNNRYTKKYAKQLKKTQQHLSLKNKNSKWLRFTRKLEVVDWIPYTKSVKNLLNLTI